MVTAPRARGERAGKLPRDGCAATPTPAAAPSVLRRTRHIGDRIGDAALYGLTAAAAILALLIDRRDRLEGLRRRLAGDPGVRAQLHLGERAGTRSRETLRGAAQPFIVGTLVTSFGAVLLAAPLSIAIGLFLSELAPPAIRGPIGTLIEMLAAVPSVVVGLWGIFVLGPFMLSHVEPFLHDYFGWIPLFGGTPQQAGVLAGDRRADDHDHPDHLVDLPRALRERARAT